MEDGPAIASATKPAKPKAKTGGRPRTDDVIRDTIIRIRKETGFDYIKLMQELRRQNLITLNGRTLTIQNLRALEELSFFNAEYLHLDYSAEKHRDVEREGAG